MEMKDVQSLWETERLIAAAYSLDFIEPLYQLKQFPETHRYNYSKVPSRKEVIQYVRTFADYNYQEPRGRMELALIHKQTQQYIGFIGFKSESYKPDGIAEIYYTLHRDYFRQGLGTEAVRAMLNYGFRHLRLHRIWAGATCENRASWSIMEKLGMQRESLWRKDRPKPGEWIPGKGFEASGQWEDGYGYAILEEDFL